MTYAKLFLLSALLFGLPNAANAMPFWDMVFDDAAIVIDTALGNLTARQEKDMMIQNWDEWRRERNPNVAVGQVAKADSFPVSEYTVADLGTTKTLTYFFIDPASGQPTLPEFTPAAVRYEALLTPPTLDKNALTLALIQQNLTILGTSFDVQNNFAFPFMEQGFEPMIIAVPLDAQGNEIIGDGTYGLVTQVLIPEPSTLFLISIGIISFGNVRRMQKRK